MWYSCENHGSMWTSMPGCAGHLHMVLSTAEQLHCNAWQTPAAGDTSAGNAFAKEAANCKVTF
jgi:hypothetical protein